MKSRYLVRRIGMFFAVIIVAATLNFAIPRLAPGDPIGAVLEVLISRGQAVDGVESIIASYRERFGLNDPIATQYLRYITNSLTLDLGYSVTFFPQKVEDTLMDALPWTIGLLAVSTLIAFGLGTFLGALIAWPRAPRALQGLVPLLMPLSAVPYYLLALILIYVLAFTLKIFPLGGAYTPATKAEVSVGYVLDIINHAVLPALSIVLAQVGFWTLGMRGTMVTVVGEDYLTLAEAKGLSNRRIFFSYAMRNALLPQVTSLAIALGGVVSGSVLVEVVFNYPGIGWLLYNALQSSDYFVVQGVSFFLVLSVALAVLIVDLIYPRLDPRIAR